MVRPSNLPLWFAAVFTAGGALGAVVVHAVRPAGPAVDKVDAHTAPRRQAEDTQLDAPRTTDVPTSPVDRAALRAVLAELLEEERSAAVDVSEPDEVEGISAAEALARLEAAYRAELEEREGLAPHALEASSGPRGASREGGRVHAEALAERMDPADETPDSGELDDAEEAAPEVAQAETPTGRSVEPASVRIDDVHVVNGDVNHVDARQTHASQVAALNHYQQVFVQPWFDTPAAPHGGQTHPPAPSSSGVSPLSKPLPSAHDQSPWSPVDYSRHHNPWGPIFGRRIP